MTTRSQLALQAILIALAISPVPLASEVFAQDAKGVTTAPAAALLKQEELDQLLAPLALYPDSLLTQILMASTYPLEVVQADRWTKANKQLKGAALTAELEKQSWDASVKSLVNFPDVLTMMNDKLDLTIKLGDAFIAQQADVMNTIQQLRGKAKKEGNLESNEQQKIVVQAPPPSTAPTVVVEQQVTPAPAQIIQIESTSPDVIYVPSYNPTVVYGSWWYPSYPPYPYYPPGYVASNMVSFGLGVAAGAAWGYAWGNCDWGNNDVDIDIDRNTNINTDIDRSKYKAEMESRQSNRQTERGTRQGERAGGQSSGRGSWQHDPQHRQGVPYRDQKSAERFGGSDRSRQATQARDSYRGRADAGRQDIARGGASGFQGVSNLDRGGAAGASNRAGAGVQDRSRTSSSGSRASTFDGVDRGGSSARASSQRGYSSRSQSSYSSPSRSRSYGGGGGGGSRSSGGGGRSRGGGGGGRGGGGRR